MINGVGKMRYLIFGLLCAGLAAAPVQAKDKYIVQPVQVGTESVRFQQGVATVTLNKEHGGVQVRPMPFDHGSLSFGIAVYNDSGAPSNIDITDISAEVGATHLTVFSVDDLQRKAKNRAMWSQIGLAALAGAAAAASASQRDTYTSTLYTPHGSYRSVYSAPSAAGQVGAVAATAGAAVGIVKIQERLDATLNNLQGGILQLTTVDPDDSYAGRIVLTKCKIAAVPQRVDLTVRWNGEEYHFAFQVAKPGTPAPVFASLATANALAQREQPAADHGSESAARTQ